MTLQAAIFDMDGVLTATVEYHYQSWKSACAEFGLPFSRELNEKLLGLTRQRSLEVILGEAIVPPETFQEILRLKNEHYLRLVEKMSADDLLPGVASLLAEMETAGIRLGVATASQNAARVLDRLGIARYFQVVVDGTAGLPSKPAPDVYLHAARLLQAAPETCLVLEDSQAGVEAALAAGMCVVGLGPISRVGQAHAVFCDLSRAHLEELVAIYNWWSAAYNYCKVKIYADWMSGS